MVKKKINVLIPDGESGNTRRVLFCLKESGNYRIFIISSNNEDINKHSRYCEKFYLSAESGFGEIRLKKVVDIISEEKIDILFPTRKAQKFEMNFDFIVNAHRVPTVAKPEAGLVVYSLEGIVLAQLTSIV